MAIFLIILAPWLATHTLAAPQLSRLLQIGAIMLVLAAVNGAQTGALSGFEAFRRIAHVNVMSGFLGLVVRVLGVCFFGLMGAVCAMVIAQAITCTIMFVQLRLEAGKVGVKVRYRGCSRELPVLWGFSLPSVLSSIVTIPASWLGGAMLVNTPGGYSEMGLFSAANQWYSALLFVPSLLGQATMPVLFERMHAQDTRGCRKIFWATVQANSCVVIPLVMLGCASKHLLGLYGEGFSRGWPVMVMVLATAGIMAIQSPAGHLIAASGRMWTLVWIGAGWAVTFIATNYVFLAWGASGMALARLVACLLNGIVAFCFVRAILTPSVHKAGDTAAAAARI
jgi:O-antigen/teichoic acid export membrane protein